MKADNFSNALNNIDDKYIEKAATYKKTNTQLKVWRVIAIAACACLVLGGAFAAIRSGIHNTSYKNDYSEAVMYEYAEESNYAAEVLYDEAYSVTDAGMGSQKRTADSTTDLSNSNTKIIYTANICLQSTEFDSAIAEIEKVTQQFGGYFEYQTIDGQSSRYRSAYYTVRIPVENFESFINQSSDICTVTSINKSASDVSSSYYDIESRLTTAQTKLTRLQELLAQAENMEDIITIESAISDVELEIDNYSGSLKYYDSQINYSTVTINLNEVYKVETEKAPLSFGEKIGEAFSNGITGFENFLEDLLIWLASSWLWIIILAAIVLAVILIIKGVRKHNRNK